MTMLTVFKDMRIRMDALKPEEIKEPTIAPEKDEQILGPMDDSLRRLYSLYQVAYKSYQAMSLHTMLRSVETDNDNPEMKGRKFADKALFNNMRLLFSLLQTEVESMYPQTMGHHIFFRKGWLITTRLIDYNDLDIETPGLDGKTLP